MNIRGTQRKYIPTPHTHTHTHLLASEHVMNTTGSPFCTCSQNKHISGGTKNSDDKNLKLEDSS